jgi:hypothetical protein
MAYVQKMNLLNEEWMFSRAEFFAYEQVAKVEEKKPEVLYRSGNDLQNYRKDSFLTLECSVGMRIR